MRTYIISINFGHLETELKEDFIKTNKEIWEQIVEILENHKINILEQVEYKPIGIDGEYSKFWKNDSYLSELKLTVDKHFDIEKLIDDLKKQFYNVVLIEE